MASDWNVLVRLEPGPVAVRVTGPSEAVRGGSALGREVELCAALARAGAPVPQPLPDVPLGPHVHEGATVTLWRWYDTGAGAGAPEEGAAVLRACHDALLEVEPSSLTDWAMLEEARTEFAPHASPQTRDLLAELGAVAAERLAGLDVPLRAVHGDPHPGNFMWTPDGALLGDWEDAQRAALEWDLACLVLSARLFGGDFGWAEAALGAYGGGWDPVALEASLFARCFQLTAYVAFLLPARPELQERYDTRLAWLRERAGRV